MRVFILSNYSGLIDEGIMNVAYHCSMEIGKSHSVLHANARKSILSIRFWHELRKFNPDIIHIFLRPNFNTLFLAKIIMICCPRAKLILSALQPPEYSDKYNYLIKKWGTFFKPNLVLTQSSKTEKIFKELGYATAFFPNGVDIMRFFPYSPKERISLRDKYKINKDKFIILHVGHIKKGRNLSVLSDLQKSKNNQVIIVASSSTLKSNHIYLNLKNNNCIIYEGYFEDLTEIYNLADCYVFPTRDESHAIEIPLSILEAMACNLPVITTEFGGLTRLFNEGGGLFFARDKDFSDILERVKNNLNINTRDRILNYSWEHLGNQLEIIYGQVLN